MRLRLLKTRFCKLVLAAVGSWHGASLLRAPHGGACFCAKLH